MQRGVENAMLKWITCEVNRGATKSIRNQAPGTISEVCNIQECAT